MPISQLVPSGPFPPGEPDVQRTTFSLDVFGRFVCSTFDEATTNPDFDAIVIGAGMYGGYCAAKIAAESLVPGRLPLRVLVLEAGPFLVPEHAQNVPDLGLTDPFPPVLDPYSDGAQRARNLVWGMGWRGNTGFAGTAYCIGGKSVYWGGWCPRLRDDDLDQWPQPVRDYLTSPPTFGANLPNRQSGAARTSVYEAVEYEIGAKPTDDFVFDPVAGPNQPAGHVGLNAALGARLRVAREALAARPAGTTLEAPEDPPIAVQTQSFVSGVFSPDKFSSVTLLFSAVRAAQGAASGSTPRERDASRRLFLVPNAHVARLTFGRLTRDGRELDGPWVNGVEVVVGGTRRVLPVKPTCAVVLALGCIESTRLALESFPTAPRRAGGDELMGRNLMAHLRFDFPFRIRRDAFAQWVRAHTGQDLAADLHTASFHIQGNTPAGRFHLQVYATGDRSGSPEGLLYRMIPDADVAQRLAALQDPDTINLVFRACGEMRGDRRAPVHAPGTSWIDLAGAADRDGEFGHARAYVNYADQASAPIWAHMRDACVALATELGAEGIPPEERHEVGSTWHDSGTLFMGTDPDASVTDVVGRFHHVGNAACVDQALFPTVGSANPVLTGLCLTRRVAESLVDRYVSAAPLSNADVAAEEAQGFAFLLRGVNAGRWRANAPRFTDGHPALIEGGTVLEVHGAAGLGILFYDDPIPFVDFELRLQYTTFGGGTADDPGANSGVFLRAPAPSAELDDAGFYSRAVEMQIDDAGYDVARGRFGSAFHRTGALYGIVPARIQAQKVPSTDGRAGVWNDCSIVARGRLVRVVLNGHTISEGDVPAERNASGFLGVQYHSGKAQFREIRVKRL